MHLFTDYIPLLVFVHGIIHFVIILQQKVYPIISQYLFDFDQCRSNQSLKIIGI